jgi:hypothetical protein
MFLLDKSGYPYHSVPMYRDCLTQPISASLKAMAQAILWRAVLIPAPVICPKKMSVLLLTGCLFCCILKIGNVSIAEDGYGGIFAPGKEN